MCEQITSKNETKLIETKIIEEKYLDIYDFNIIVDKLKPKSFIPIENWNLFARILKYKFNVDNPISRFIELFNTEVFKKMGIEQKQFIKCFNDPKNNLTYDLDLDTFFKIVKEDISNDELYKKLMLQINIRSMLKTQDEIFKNYTFEINNIINSGYMYYVVLKNKYCFIARKEHNKPMCPYPIYIKIYDYGKMYMGCNECDCIGKEYPYGMIHIEKNLINQYFSSNSNTINNTINITNIINNYGPNIIDNNLDNYLDNINSNYMPNSTLNLICSFKLYDDVVLNNLVKESLICTDDSISNLIVYLMDNKYMFDNNLYEFNDRWKIIDEDIMFNFAKNKGMTFYSDFMTKLYEKDIGEYNLINISNRLCQIKNKLKDINKSNTLFNTIKLGMSNIGFEKLLNSDKYLIAFDDGIFNLNNNNFRKISENDMISYSVGYNFPKEYYNKDDLLIFLKNILPNNNIRDYFLKYLSISLISKNENDVFIILTGFGDDGRIELIKLLKITFGDYLNFQPNNKKKKIIICNKLNEEEKIDIESIKLTITNNENNINFLPILLSNNIPTFTKKSDNIRYIHFPNKIDKLKDKILRSWKGDFMLLLFEYYNKYLDEDIETPKRILKNSIIYKINNNKYLTFLDECTKESDKHIHVVTLRNAFKKWYNDNYPNEDRVTDTEFLTEIKKYVKYADSVNEEGKISTGFKNLGLKSF